MGVTWNPDPAIGVDLRLSSVASPGDLAVAASGDLDLIGNAVPLQNMWQATILRLITTLGTYLFAKNYGTKLRRFIDEPMTDALTQQIRIEVTNTVLSDPRIKQINTLTVTQSASNPQGYNIQLSFTAVSSNQIIGGIFPIEFSAPNNLAYAIWGKFNWNDGSVYWR